MGNTIKAGQEPVYLPLPWKKKGDESKLETAAKEINSGVIKTNQEVNINTDGFSNQGSTRYTVKLQMVINGPTNLNIGVQTPSLDFGIQITSNPGEPLSALGNGLDPFTGTARLNGKTYKLKDNSKLKFLLEMAKSAPVGAKMFVAFTNDRKEASLGLNELLQFSFIQE